VLIPRADTEALCEKALEVLPENGRVLDLCTGSGALATAIAHNRKDARVFASDLSTDALLIARENAAYNGFSAPSFTALTGNVTTDKPLMSRLSQTHYDTVLVNIVADVIIGLAPVLPSFLSESSNLICSGILDSRLNEVVAAIEQAGLTVTSIRAKEDWRCITAKRSNPL
jgi:ribosomal protein L11 methyltransferase